MLISKVPDDDGGRSEECSPPEENNGHEYQTASELFELMAKNQNIHTSDGDSLPAIDLVLLYKNIDLGTKLMTSVHELKREKPNQYVESVIYNDEPDTDGSDVSDVYSSEDLQNVYLINNERIDLLNNQPSVENTLCHKFGNHEIQSSIHEYDKHFIFKDPYIEEKLKNFNLYSSNDFEGTVLPASLLDYVCCKRLEDNYNFYMDNIIRYVKNTIEQLKRISNGDYLTDKAKEKWREVQNVDNTAHNTTKVLATSTSIPLHVECKIGGRKSTWDDIVHSAVDIRSLSKILEKKIVIEIPKVISGSYKLLSKCCADNLIISCKKENQPVESRESRVDVVFHLKRSETGHVISNINSIMILPNTPAVHNIKAITELPSASPLALMYKNVNDTNDTMNSNVKTTNFENKVKIVELDSSSDGAKSTDVHTDDDFVSSDEMCADNLATLSQECRAASIGEDLSESSDTQDINLTEPLVFTQKEASFDVCPDDLRVTIQSLSIQSTLPEESIEDVSQSTTTKKKSPTRVRIKSPYENQSYIIEEKKRRKLLEIREKRERKKMALAESCKITKHRYGKGAPMPQATSSVTKLSITNKSFYNSIYGQSTNLDHKLSKNRNRKDASKKEVSEMALEDLGSEQEPPKVPEKNTKKFINRSYYLDDAVTEMMYMNMKQEEKGKEICSASTSAVSNDFQSNFSILSALIAPYDSDDGAEANRGPDVSPVQKLPESAKDNNDQESNSKELCSPQSKIRTLPLSTPKNLKLENEKKAPKNNKMAPSVECRKSIDKIYQLMKKMGNSQDTGGKMPQNKSSVNTINRSDVAMTGKGNSSIQGSDSGTSLKHLTSSNPSTFSFDKNNNAEIPSGINKKLESPTNVVSKVIISSKSHISTQRAETEKNKKARKRTGSSPVIVQENPLKAISQILHEFENVQRTRVKSGTEQKSVKRVDTNIPPVDSKTVAPQGPYRRRSRFEQHDDTLNKSIRLTTPKDRKLRPVLGMDVPKIPYQHVPVDDRYIEKAGKKKITDIIDEAKEARGEAVRGPSKFTSRLNSLAQPKRSYVQAHSEEYQTRYGRNLITDRLQKLATTPTPPATHPVNLSLSRSKNRPRRTNGDLGSPESLKMPLPSGLPIERPARSRHSRNNSPEEKDLRSGTGPSFKQNNVPEAPEILKKKMVAVESYVKNHYGCASSLAITGEPNQNPQKSRVPLLPNDIDIDPSILSPLPEESTEVGIKLHRIIDSMIKHASQDLGVLTECHETNSRSSKHTIDDSSSFNENLKGDERISTDSDYTTGTTDDGILLTSNIIRDVCKKEQATDKKYEIQPFKSATGLEKSESDLCRNLSVGTFSKPHTFIKNLALSPKPSIFLYQSGDAGSLVVKTSQNFQTDKLLDLKTSSVLPQAHIDWSFTKIPMQITTVGYAFPEYKSVRSGSPPTARLLENISRGSINKTSMVAPGKCLYHHKDGNKILAQNENAEGKSYKDVSMCSRATQPEPSPEPPLQNNDIPKLKTLCKECCNNNAPHVSHHNEDSSHVKKVVIDDNKTQYYAESGKQSDITSRPGDIDYTTSLDILVGLLNEIKKMTTCHTHITNNEDQEDPETEIILQNTAAVTHSAQSSPENEKVSITSLDKLRGLESNPSLYSFYLSDNEGHVSNGQLIRPNILTPWHKEDSFGHKPICADKGVSVDITPKEFVNKLTDIPSIIFPINISHSTHMTNSVVKELCQSSSQSFLSMSDYRSAYSNMSSIASTYTNASSKRIVELPEIIRINDSSQSLACYYGKQEVKKHNVTKQRKQKTISVKDAIVEKKLNNIKNDVSKSAGFDPIMKIKRDILVTLYSMLVLTVFAALSFPEMYHV